uniref:pituitary tumor-transforming gene 1 protein-interacting protein-like n=1 Tax=Pristiophorus japonicus TaxID=55135 RepID=UPI00398F0D74
YSKSFLLYFRTTKEKKIVPSVTNFFYSSCIDCSDLTNTSCEECLENVNCLWCFVDQRCMKYPIQSIIPPSSTCPLYQARWGVCWVNFESLIIAMSIVGGLVLFLMCCCCCCCKKKICCCCRKKSHGLDQEEARLARQQEERKQRSEE